MRRGERGPSDDMDGMERSNGMERQTGSNDDPQDSLPVVHGLQGGGLGGVLQGGLLPGSARLGGAQAARVPAAYVPSLDFLDEDSNDSRLPISQYLWIVKRYRWRILGFVLASVLVTVIISARLIPIYESTATVDIDRQTPVGVIGEESARTVTNDADQFLATQIKLVESDSVLRPVEQQFHLRAEEGQTSALTARGAPVKSWHALSAHQRIATNSNDDEGLPAKRPEAKSER